MSRPFVLGLTGSIGMGKSTTLAMFADHGARVWDADATVHQLYEKGGAAVGPVSQIVPEANVAGAIDRTRLKARIASEPDILLQLEAIVHPLVSAHRASFIETANSDLVVCDIPLLFETGSEDEFDAIAVVSAPPALQRERVLSRPGMTQAHFDRLLSKQMSDEEKRARADFVIPTNSLEVARNAVADVVLKIRQHRADAGNRT